ncbi:hypothetical protein AB6A40_004971 [Gnathostoma spinigerum]|uniref:Protein-cysteine N-palmitoyltransferase Rasp n=1 Tax=Gnathostoma spinigerum TaxID=75299 RepID=A0ABD6ENZ1_9BILA
MTSDANSKSEHRPRFSPCFLPNIEEYIYFAVWLFHSVAAFVIAWNVSSKLSFWLEHWTVPNRFFPSLHRDYSDLEWSVHRTNVLRFVVITFLQSALFHILRRQIPNVFTVQVVMLVVWLLNSLFLTSLPCVVITAVLASVCVISTSVTKSQLPCWVLCLFFMNKASAYLYFSSTTERIYVEYNLYLYSAVKILNFCIHLTRNPNLQLDKALLIRFLQYMLYPPYLTLLIVLFDDFDAQMTAVEAKYGEPVDESKKKEIALRFVRLLFWHIFYDLLLHFIHVNSLFSSSTMIVSGLSRYELASVAYVNGMFFFIKYVNIFGVPAWFASLDGLTPPAAPFCISRISCYSQLWRNFDRGLYQFLKHQVYIPIIGSPYSSWFGVRRFGAMVLALLFVLLWHGPQSNYLKWVILNGIELTLENIASYIWKTSNWKNLREKIGVENERRLIAAVTVIVIVPGIFGVFFFLSREGNGDLVFDRIFTDGIKDIFSGNIRILDGVPTAGFVGVHLIILAYFFSNVCLYFDAKECKRNAVTDGKTTNIKEAAKSA